MEEQRQLRWLRTGERVGIRMRYRNLIYMQRATQERNVRSPRRRQSQCPEGGGRVALRNSGWFFKPLHASFVFPPFWPPFITPYTTLINIHLLNVTPFTCIPKPYGKDVLTLDPACCCHASLPCIIDVDIKINHQRIQTTCLHASHCHLYNYCRYCNVDFVLFHNVTCYNNSLLSCIHANTTKLLNITCTLVATSVILQSLESTS